MCTEELRMLVLLLLHERKKWSAASQQDGRLQAPWGRQAMAAGPLVDCYLRDVGDEEPTMIIFL